MLKILPSSYCHIFRISKIITTLIKDEGVIAEYIPKHNSFRIYRNGGDLYEKERTSIGQSGKITGLVLFDTVHLAGEDGR